MAHPGRPATKTADHRYRARRAACATARTQSARRRSCACESCWAAQMGSFPGTDCPALGHDGATRFQRRRYRAYHLAGLTDARALAARAVWATSRFSFIVDKVRQSKPRQRHALERAPDEVGTLAYRPRRCSASGMPFGLKPNLQETFPAIDGSPFLWTRYGMWWLVWHHLIAPLVLCVDRESEIQA